jgi:hypothetical protein
MRYFSPRNKIETSQLFIHNLLWGKVTINYEKFRTREEGLQYVQEMYEKINRWDGEELCASDDHETLVNEITSWLYEAIMKGRVYGAIIGELHDNRYEDRIEELEKQVEQMQKEKTEVISQRDQVVAELAQLKTSEPPMKNDFTAMR